ncbi:MAG: DHHA1 domain-containing protein, partial [bacterium]|nr:DHHA1 domain-containing protein [bacterium]
KYGLLVLKKSKHLGLKKLLEIAHIDLDKIDAQTISFSVGPRINAAGRMDHANLAYYMLIEEDEDKATQLANDINQSNLDRQKLTDQVVREAKNLKVDLSDTLLTFYKETWPAGLTGLVAGKLLREYGKPCVVMTKVADQIIGSSRSISGFNITDALKENESLINRFGGHPQAAGFAIKEENMAKLMTNLKAMATKQLAGADLTPKIDIELEIDFEDIAWDLVDLLDKFSPYGQENPEPLFMSKGIKISSARKVGLDQKHWKLELSKGNKSKGAIAFGLGELALAVGDSVDIVYNLSINQWNGNREIQLIIRDIRLAD